MQETDKEWYYNIKKKLTANFLRSNTYKTTSAKRNFCNRSSMWQKPRSYVTNCWEIDSFNRSWRTDFSLPVLRQTVVIDTFFAFRSFLLEEQNFQLPLSVRSLLTWRARVKRNPLVTVKIRVAGLSWARNQ